MSIKTKNKAIADETRAIQKISKVLDDFDPAVQKRIIKYVATMVDPPATFPLTPQISTAE